MLLSMGQFSAGPCDGKEPGYVLASDSQKLGHGFRLVRREVCVDVSFESVGHYDFLFFKRRELGSVGQWSISPTGRFALFEGVGTLNAWAKDIANRGLAGALSNVAAAAPSAKGRMEKWTVSSGEMVACTGWHTLASIARQDNGLPDGYFVKYLETIESKVHASKNWVKYAMNNALINIGVRNPSLERKAVAAAKRMGGVEVDHGETGCKTPDAAAYIKKTVAHRRKRANQSPGRVLVQRPPMRG